VIRRLAALAAAAVVLGGCSSFSEGLYGKSLPGSAGAGGYKLVAVFDNVTDLVPQASVRVNNVTVGAVTKIALDSDLKAKVVMTVARSVKLPANSEAILSQTSLLGEKFVELGPPPGVAPQGGPLPPGSVIQSTTAYPDLEQIFGALSLVLNGGGIGQLETIDYELTQALSGHERRVQDLLSQLNFLVGGLNTQKAEIVRALDDLDALSSQFNAQQQTLSYALANLGPGLKILADQRSQLVNLLSSLSNLGVVATRIIHASQQATATDLADLKPVVQRIAAAGSALPRSFDLLLDWPFPLSAAGAIPGDYTALYVTLVVNGPLCAAVALPICPPVSVPAAPRGSGAAPQTSAGGAPSGGLRLPIKIPGLPSVLPVLPAPVGIGLRAIERLLANGATP
jgi:phospholipid/cholesterol/gamma-HCH transport system substrate-binding protein